jgi:hypothetical protein
LSFLSRLAFFGWALVLCPVLVVALLEVILENQGRRKRALVPHHGRARSGHARRRGARSSSAGGDRVGGGAFCRVSALAVFLVILATFAA